MATFHRFSQLPVELHYRIWRASIPDTGRVVLLLASAIPYHKRDKLGSRSFRASLNLPAAYACREARSAILRPETTLTMYPPAPLTFTKCPPAPIKPVSVYFNYELDTLFDPRFEDSHYCRLNPRYAAVIKAEDYRKVRHIMVNVNLEKPWHFQNQNNGAEHSVGPNMYPAQYSCPGPQKIYPNLRSFTVHVHSPSLAQYVEEQIVFRWSGYHVGRIAELGRRFVFRFSIPLGDRNEWTERDGDLFISWSSEWKSLGRDLENAIVSMTTGGIKQPDGQIHKKCGTFFVGKKLLIQ
ncbi:MAG: hypothetical protein Q9167_001325 [Letrouitia subvulpina]